MIEYKLGKEYTFTVVAQFRHPPKFRKRMRTKKPILHLVKDEDGRVFIFYHNCRFHKGRIIKCMVRGFTPDRKPTLVLAMSEYPKSSRPRSDTTRTSAHLVYIPMGNKR